MTPDDVSEIPLFEGLSPAGLERVAARSRGAHLRAGADPRPPGDPGSGMYVVLDVTVSAEMRGASRRARPGNSFGETAPRAGVGPRRARAGRDARALPQRAQGRLHQARRERAAVRADDAARSRVASATTPSTAEPRTSQLRPYTPRMARENGTRLIAENRRARRDYELLERVEAGVVLTGTE